MFSCGVEAKDRKLSEPGYGGKKWVPLLSKDPRGSRPGESEDRN
jgi:hypothetical protein